MQSLSRNPCPKQSQSLLLSPLSSPRLNLSRSPSPKVPVHPAKVVLVIQVLQEQKGSGHVKVVSNLVTKVVFGELAKAKFCPELPRSVETRSTTTVTAKQTPKTQLLVLVTLDKPKTVTLDLREQKALGFVKKVPKHAMPTALGELAKVRYCLERRRSAVTNSTITAMV